MEKGSHPFGAILVAPDNETVLIEQGNIDTVNHAESTLARLAAEKYDSDFLWECTLYTTAEPCCMCQGAVLWAGIPRVVFGTSIDTLKRMGWKQIDIPAKEVVQRTPEAECRLVGGILEQECDALFRAARGEPIQSDHGDR